MRNTKNLIFISFLFWNLLFFSFCSIAGFNYEEVSSTPYYLMGIIFLAISAFVFIILGNNKSLFKRALYTIIFPVLILMAYLCESALDGAEYFQYLKYYLGFGIPATFIGADIASRNAFHALTRWFDIAMIIVSLGLVVSLPAIVFNSVISVGGASYQQMAYMSATAFLINLCGFLYGDQYDRFAIFNNKYIKVICFVLLIVQLVCCLYSGGRGGFIMLVAGALVLLFYRHKISYAFYILIFIALLYFVSTLYKGTIFYDVIGTRMERTFSFISSTGSIDTQTRGEVWDYGFAYIKDHGLFGGGLYKYYMEFRANYDQPYAHNLFLDYLCQGGVLYFVFWIILLFKFFKKLFMIIRLNHSHLLLMVLCIYVFVELMFSNTYLFGALYWFLLSYVHSYDNNTATI